MSNDSNVIPLQFSERSTLTGVKKAKGVDFSEIGLSGIKRFGGNLYEEFLQNLQGQQGISVYTEMRDNDAIIGAVLLAIEQVIRKTSWFIDPATNDNEGLKAAEFLSSCMMDMSHTWQDFITDVLSMLAYGWAWMEIVYKLRKGDVVDPRGHSRYSDGNVGWRKIVLRKQNSLYEWEFDEQDGGIRAMLQQPPPMYDVRRIPIEKSLLFRVKGEGNNPEGRSILRNAYRCWYLKKSFEMLEAIGAERDLIGLPVITPPDGFDVSSAENASIRRYIHRLIANLRRDEQEGVFLPPGFKIELLSSGNSRRQFDLDKMINRCDKRLAISVLAQFIMLGMDRVGSFALSKSSDDVFLVSVQGYLDNISSVLNTYAAPRLFAQNPEFSYVVKSGKYPRFTPGRVTEPNLADLGTYISGLVKVGCIRPTKGMEKELRRIGGMDAQWTRETGAVQESDDNSELLPPPTPQVATGTATKPKSKPKPKSEPESKPESVVE